MEFKRELQSGAALSVLVVSASPLPIRSRDSNEVTVKAYGDAAESYDAEIATRGFALLLLAGIFQEFCCRTRAYWTRASSRREDCRRLEVTRLGVIGRFTSDIKTFNYPEHVETAHELELAVRSLLPRDIVSEPAVADAFALADRA